MAVRDTCVVPTFETKKKKNKMKNGDANGDKPKSNAEVFKPRGYTFTSADPDPWLLPYRRVTVPSFSLVQDNQDRQKHERQQQADITSSNTQVFVWTPHGRQPLTPELYANASQGLKSRCTLSLYDMSNVDNKKRQERALARTQQWFLDLSERQKDTDTELWAPVLIPPETDDGPLSLHHVQDNLQVISGVALIGHWRDGLDKQLQELGVSNICLLATQSLSELLAIACSKSINIAGTELPTRWSKAMRALGVDYQLSDGTKRLKTDGGDEPSFDSDGCMDLHDKRYARDARPLMVGCACLACKNDQFSRAYIHHLVCAKELVAEILLFGHNLHYLLGLCREFNSCDDPAALKDHIQKQLAKPE
jgi:queuine tRNA-ribosyltransferase